MIAQPLPAARVSSTIAQVLNKVPQVTLVFWLINLLSTTMDETGADYLAVHVGLGTGVTSGLTAGLLLSALILQLHADRGAIGIA